ncbi:MAG: hypothetical protein SNJ70_02495 [Armatimonadota bacterium]
MICQVCGKKPAERLVIRVRQGETIKLPTCVDCAEEKINLYSQSEIKMPDIITRLSLKLGKKSTSFSCELCGLTLAEIAIDKQPGCSMCYTRFYKELETSIESVQGKYPHFGKIPQHYL